MRGPVVLLCEAAERVFDTLQTPDEVVDELRI
jgi:hypothetical protein